MGKVLTTKARCGHNVYMSNRTIHHAILDADTGETLFTEKCRDTLGGFHNMTGRIAARLGGDRMRPVDPFATDLVWTVGEHRIRTMQVQKL